MRSIVTLLGIILVALGLFALVVLFGGAGMTGMMGLTGFNTGFGRIGPGMMSGYVLFGRTIPSVLWALLIGVVGLLAIRIARSSGRTSIRTSRTSVGGSPLDILKSRYANSEITKEQFSEMRKNLVA